MKYPKGCPDYIRLALLAFSEYELESLIASVDATGTFLGLGFAGPEGLFTRFSEPMKAIALRILDENYLDWVPPDPCLLEKLQTMLCDNGLLR